MTELEYLAGESVLVTGATGMIGRALVDKLMSAPFLIEVYASGRNPARADEIISRYDGKPNFHYFTYDVTMPLDCDRTFDYIFHCAGNAGPSFFMKEPVEVITANICGVVNLLEYGRRHYMKRFLYVSSGEVYGDGNTRMWNENDAGKLDFFGLRSCYPSAKRTAETLCKAYCEEYGLDVVVARLCHVYGPSFKEQEDRVFAQFIRNAVEGGEIVMKSAGNQIRSWLFIDDCISALLTLMFRGEKGEAYNVANEDSTASIREMAEVVAELSGSAIVFENTSDQEKKADWSRRVSLYNTSKIRKLGWKPVYGIKEGLNKTIIKRRNSQI